MNKIKLKDVVISNRQLQDIMVELWSDDALKHENSLLD